MSAQSDKSIGPPNSEDAQVAVEWKVGDVILGLYEVKQVFEGGGMGLVYRVHHKGWNMDLAVKSPRANYFQTEAQKENFVRECETWINLGLHPHIVSCHYVRTLGCIPRVFAEYVDGGSLKEWIDDRKLYQGGRQEALKRILDIAIQMAWGLHYAHEQELIHQDVKPANVLMLSDGMAKISDFGLAKACVAAGESLEAGAGTTILVSSGGHTPAYCSPEQSNKDPLSRKTDIWSWAVSVLEMFVGEVNWPSGTVALDWLRRLNEVRVEGVEIPEPPPELRKLLKQCFAAEPAARPENFLVVANSVKNIYSTTVGGDYARVLSGTTEIQGDALNNRAVSMLDLGRPDEAENLFDQALAMDFSHPQANYNRGLQLWRSARLTDDAIVQTLEESQISRPGDWNVPHLLGLVHLERGDAAAAIAALSVAEKLKTDAQIQQALAAARSMEPCALRRIKTFEGHTGWVTSVAFSTNYCWALSGSGDQTVRLWEVNSGKCLRTFEGHTNPVESVVLSTDGRWALSGSSDKTLRLWDLNSGKCIRTLEGHSHSVTSVALSTDGRWALSGSGDKTLRLWDLNSGKCIRIFGPTGEINSVVLSADVRWGLSGSYDHTLRLWEISSGKCVRTFEGHADSVKSVALSADGCRALSGSADRTVRLWDMSSGKCLRILNGHMKPVESVALSADGISALSGGGWDNTVRLWDVISGRCLRTIKAFAKPVALSADGRWALSAYGKVDLWDMGRQCLIAPLTVCRSASTAEALLVQKRFHVLLNAARRALSEDGYADAWTLAAESRALAGYQFSDKALDMAHQAGLRGTRTGLRGGWCRRTIELHSQRVNSVALSAEGRWALSGSDDKTLRLWELSSGKCLKSFEGHTYGVTSVALSPDGLWALSGCHENPHVRLWELSKGTCLRTFEGHRSTVESVALSTDGSWILSGGLDNTVRLWGVKCGKCLRTFAGHTGYIISVALSMDGRLALSGSHDKTLRLWEVITGSCLTTFTGHTGYVTSVALSANGRWALSGSDDSTLRLWAVSSGKCLRTFNGHTDRVLSVALSADGHWAVSGSYDNTLRVWEVSSGKCLRTFTGHNGYVASVALSADGRWVLSGSYDNTIRLWELDWNYEFPKQKNWDDGANPYLEIFLTLHCAVGKDGFTRVGKSKWVEEDFQKLLIDLQYRGYGWLCPEGVRRRLENMTIEWRGPRPMSQGTECVSL